MKKFLTVILLWVLCMSSFSMLTLISKADEITASLYVDPSSVKFWTPAYGKTFTVNVTVANVTGLYGYEFKLYYDPGLLDVVGVNVTPPAQWNDHYFIAYNNTNKGIGRYWLAISATPPATAFSGNATLATLTFKIIYDPIYPDNVESALDLSYTMLSDENAEFIPILVHDGQYTLNSSIPFLTVSANTGVYTSKKMETVRFSVEIGQVVDLYEYEFTLSYNASLMYCWDIKLGNFLKDGIGKYSKGPGWVFVQGYSKSMAERTSGGGVLAIIDLEMSPVVWPDPGWNSTLHLSDTLLWGGTPLQLIAHQDVDANYSYSPIPGDVNSDGNVNVQDLMFVAIIWGATDVEGKSWNWDPRMDLNRDGWIDIFDLVLVAKNQGRTDP